MVTESPTVLLIEDHEDTRKMLALLFDEWGYQATLAPTATEGLKHLLEQGFAEFTRDALLFEAREQAFAMPQQAPALLPSGHVAP